MKIHFYLLTTSFIDPDYNTIPPISVNLSILFNKNMLQFEYNTLKYLILLNNSIYKSNLSPQLLHHNDQQTIYKSINYCTKKQNIPQKVNPTIYLYPICF